MARTDFLGVLYNGAAGMGFDRELSMVDFPIDQFLVGSDISPIAERATDFRRGLVEWAPNTTETGMREPSKVRVEANGYEAAADQMNQLFLRNTWSDGLPVVPPTNERVDWILKGTDLPRDHVVGQIMPKGGIATVETIGVSLAMAGGRPEYLSVL
ncbi:MAG: hypothetical protein CFH10_01793, partial [Alphaproteobacteria bacterium MarineAlpha4_Bin2]